MLKTSTLSKIIAIILGLLVILWFLPDILPESTMTYCTDTSGCDIAGKPESINAVGVNDFGRMAYLLRDIISVSFDVGHRIFNGRTGTTLEEKSYSYKAAKCIKNRCAIADLIDCNDFNDRNRNLGEFRMRLQMSCMQYNSTMYDVIDLFDAINGSAYFEDFVFKNCENYFKKGCRSIYTNP